MTTMSIRLPESIHSQLRTVARKDGVSINQLVVTALAEKLSALMTADYLEERAQRGRRDRFEAVLRKVPSQDPDPWDRWDNAEPYAKDSSSR